MNAENKKSDHYNPIKDRELYNETFQNEDLEFLREIAEGDTEIERKARIERNNYLRNKRKEFYHLRMTLAFIGVGMFSLVSGYTISQLKNSVEENNKETVRVDGVIISQEVSAIIYQDWKLKLVNNDNKLNFINIPELTTLANGVQVDARIEEDLNKMIDVGRAEAGLDILVTQGYLSRVDQVVQFNSAVEDEVQRGATYLSAYNTVLKSMQQPGYNERELGLTVTLLGRDYQNMDMKQRGTATAIWLAENCHRFGFVLRYPEGKESITGENYKSWCFRYVGTNVATIIMNEGKTLEEYINTK